MLILLKTLNLQRKPPKKSEKEKMKRIVRKIRSWFTPTPTVPFTWEKEAFI